MSGSAVYPAAVLVVGPEALPRLRRALDDTLVELSPLLERMQREAHIPEPWLGDSASYATWAVYTERVMGAPDGPFRAMVAYERQLVAIRDRLGEIERAYAENEATTGDLFGSRA
jgi:glutamate synthase domain-containing protein 1